MKLAYNNDTGRIKRTYWRADKPQWFDNPPEGCDVAEESLSQESRQALIHEANQIYEADKDYDPDNERSVGHLCYDAESGEIYPDAEIKEIEEDE